MYLRLVLVCFAHLIWQVLLLLLMRCHHSRSVSTFLLQIIFSSSHWMQEKLWTAMWEVQSQFHSLLKCLFISQAFRGEHHKFQAIDCTEILLDHLSNKLQRITTCSLDQRKRMNNFTDSWVWYSHGQGSISSAIVFDNLTMLLEVLPLGEEPLFLGSPLFKALPCKMLLFAIDCLGTCNTHSRLMVIQKYCVQFLKAKERN